MSDAANVETAEQYEQLRRAAMATAVSVRSLQRRAETELLEARVQLEARSAQLSNTVSLLYATLQSSLDAIVAIDLSCRIVTFNNRFALLLDLPEEVIASGDTKVTDDRIKQLVADRDLFTKRAQERIQHPEIATFDEISFRDGRTFERYATPQLIDSASVGVVVTWRDISERKRTEAAQLHQQKMEALGVIAGGIAHDFNNILASIRGNTVLARHDIAPDSCALESLDQIEMGANRAVLLVQKILAFSRQVDNHPVIQPLGPVVLETLALLRVTIPVEVKINSELPDAAISASVDATEISQVLMNLCINGWHALRGGAGQIVLRLDDVFLDGSAQSGIELPAGRYARISVSDTGEGMDAATRARIFEPFFTTKPVGKGTGLGLSVAHGIIKSHRGIITVKSAPDEGTTFDVYIPAADSPATIVRPFSNTILSASGEGRHVLYLDDDESMVFMIRRLLERSGYRVSGFTVAAEALEAVRTRPDDFDMVVTDFNMPRESGVDVAHAIAKIRPSLPVVITSGYITNELRDRAMEAGVRQLICKSSSLEELIAAIAQLLAPRES